MLQKGLELIAGTSPASICRGAEMLARTGQPEAVEALLPLLRSRSETVQDCVRQALERMPVEPVLLGWWRGGDAQKREQAATYAALLSHPGLMELYREAAGDESPAWREKAAIGLKRQKPGPEVFHLLAALAADPDQDVRWWAVDSLGILGGPEAVSILEERRSQEAEPNLKPFVAKALRSAQRPPAG